MKTITEELLAELEQIQQDASDLTPDYDAQEYLGNLAGRIIACMAELQADADRYRYIADNACDVTMSASMTDYGDGDKTPGPRVQIDPGQYPVETFGSAKKKLDEAIDSARSSATR